jgi:hypothetical protein
MDVWTQNIIGGTFTITREMGFYRINVLASGGAIGITGNATIPDPAGGAPLASQEILIPDGSSQFLSAGTSGPINNVIINPNGFTAILQCFYS